MRKQKIDPIVARCCDQFATWHYATVSTAATDPPMLLNRFTSLAYYYARYLHILFVIVGRDTKQHVNQRDEFSDIQGFMFTEI